MHPRKTKKENKSVFHNKFPDQLKMKRRQIYESNQRKIRRKTKVFITT